MSQDQSVITVGQALTQVSPGRLRWLMRSGRWQSPARGVVVRHSGPLSRAEIVAVELLAHGPQAVVAGVTAAALDGLRQVSDERIHLLLPHGGRNRRRAGVVVRRARTLTPDDIHPLRWPRRTRTARSIVDGASWAPTDLAAQAILASAVQQGLVTHSSLAAVLDRLPKLRRRQLIAETICDVAGGALSEYEVLFARICRKHRLPQPDRQVRRRDAAGRLRYLDAVFDDYDLVAEIDGQQHMESLAWWEDMTRNNELVAVDGKSLLRFAGFALRHQPEQVAAVLRAYFQRQGPSRS